MHLLIQLIVWLIKEIFGDQEPQAKVGPRASSKRGPYDYGDGRSSPRQKSLADLLEEAKENSPTTQSNRRPPQPKPARPAQTQPRTADRPKTRPAPPQTTTKISPTRKPKQAKRKTPVTEFHQFKAADTDLHDFHFTEKSNHSFTESAPIKVRPPIAEALTPILDELKNASKEEKRLAVARTLMAVEIFGPPRCMRPYRPPQLS